MSALGAAFGKGIGAVGGPQVAALVVAGGLVIGALGGGFIAGGGGGRQGTAATALSIYPCPDSGPALAMVGSGQKFLVTGKNGDGSWVRIYYPLPDRSEAWVTSGPLQIDGSLSAIPIVPCSPVIAGPAAPGQPGASLTAIEDNSPTPAPSGSEAPPPPPQNGAPSVARLASTPGTIAGGPQRYCANTARAVTVSVRVTDTEPIASVILSYRRPGLSGYATKPMARGGGANTWQATLRTDTDGIDTAGDLRFFVTATDTNPSPRSTRLPADGSRSITVAGCENKGPVLASLKAGPGKVFTNLAACTGKPKTTTVSVKATDVDDVAGVTLHYRLPGDGSFRDAPMRMGGAQWNAAVTPVAQRPNADGKVAYYVVGEDKAGETSRSATQTFTVDRCNVPATVASVNWDSPQVCASGMTVFATITRGIDLDGIGAQSAKAVYTFTPKGGSKKTLRKTLAQTQVIGDGHYYSDQFNLSALEVGSTVYMYVQLTDKYGDTTKFLSPKEIRTFQVPAGC